MAISKSFVQSTVNVDPLRPVILVLNATSKLSMIELSELLYQQASVPLTTFSIKTRSRFESKYTPIELSL